jgi:hypothetical protein
VGGRGDLEVVKSFAKRRLERKIKLYSDRQQRFEDDVRGFWRNKKFANGTDREVQ